ncbi:MAG: MopE-related protein [bacterium]
MPALRRDLRRGRQRLRWRDRRDLRARVQPEAEICDGADNDCDQQVDEGCGDCVAEVCNGDDDDCDGTIDEGCPACEPRPELCNGLDEDCDGMADEGCADCAGAPEQCNGLDDDCDNIVDEGVRLPAVGRDVQPGR